MQTQNDAVVGRGELAKTLDGEFDEYAVLLSMCLGRIERDINGRVLELEKEKVATKRGAALKSLKGSYREAEEPDLMGDIGGGEGSVNQTSSRLFITNAAGHLQDVSHRRAMGAQPDEMLHSRDAFLHRTDVVVARSALVRLASEAARFANSMRLAEETATVLESQCLEQQSTITRQERQIKFLETMLEDVLSSVSRNMQSLGEGAPGAGMHISDLSWAQHYINGRVSIDEGEGKFKALYDEWQRRMGDAGGLEGEVSERREMLNHFRSKVGSIVGESNKVSAEDDTASSLTKSLSPNTQENLQEQRRQADLHVTNMVQRTAQTRVTSLEAVKEILKEADRPVQFTAEHEEEHFVIRRDIQSKGRVVRKQGASSSIVGRIVTAILYAPASALHLQVCMNTTTGRRHQLQRQAVEANFSEVWEELSKYPEPYLQLITVSGDRHLKGDGSQVAGGRDVRNLIVNEDGDVEEFEERRIQREKRQAFRRLNEGLFSGRKRFGAQESEELDGATTITSMAVASPGAGGNTKTTTSTLQQRPGLIHFVGTDCGKRPWTNPVRTGAIRVAVSSTLPPSNIEAILCPFTDPRTSYFSTRNEPGQFISVAFDRMVVVPTAYSFASTHPISGGEYPRNWRFEASCDGVDWTCLRRHTNDDSLNKHTPTCTWPLERSTQNSTFFTMFRIVAEGPNVTGGDALCATCFEVYGKVAYVVENPFPSLEPVSAPDPRPSGFTPMGGMPTIKEPKGKGKGKK